MNPKDEKICRLYAGNGKWVRMPESLMNSTIVRFCSHLTSTIIPKRVMTAAVKATSQNPKQPSLKMRELLYEYSTKVWIEISKNPFLPIYEKANKICADKYTEYQEMYKKRYSDEIHY